MLKIENTVTPSPEQWRAVIRGMRNPMNSWDKSDSYITHIEDPETLETADYQFVLGDADAALMQKLAGAGSDHAKFRRMLTVTCDIVAPQLWVAELDTYKVSTVRNSCSLQHKGASRPYSIRDFSVPRELYEILSPEKESKTNPLIYPVCEKDDYKLYSLGDREYKIYSNGRVFACAYERKHEADNRVRSFGEREVLPSQTPNGYYELNLGGRRFSERWLLHRLVATVWLGEGNGLEVNHKDGNKGNNAVGNLEWVTHQANEKHKYENGLSGRTLHTDYLAWKNATKYSTSVKRSVIQEYKRGSTQRELSELHGISQPHISEIIRNDFCENNALFELAEAWEEIISRLNYLRELYLSTGDYGYFEALRQLMPMGYNYRFTWQANYEVLANIYRARRNHKLTEWHTFCEWIEKLPYFEIIIGGKESV